MLLKASAFCNGRTETNHSDAILLKYCLWTTPENRQPVEQIVMNAIKTWGFDTKIDLGTLDRDKERLEKEIYTELYYSEDIYDTVKLKDGDEYFKVFWKDIINQTVYIKASHLKSNMEFKIIDSDGNEIRGMNGNFKGQGSCELIYKRGYYTDTATYTPKLLFHKGDKKTNINKRLIKSLLQSVRDTRRQFSENLKVVEAKYTDYQQFLYSPFVTQTDINTAVSGITKQIEDLNLRIKDCGRLESLCR